MTQRAQIEFEGHYTLGDREWEADRGLRRVGEYRNIYVVRCIYSRRIKLDRVYVIVTTCNHYRRPHSARPHPRQRPSLPVPYSCPSCPTNNRPQPVNLWHLNYVDQFFLNYASMTSRAPLQNPRRAKLARGGLMPIFSGIDVPMAVRVSPTSSGKDLDLLYTPRPRSSRYM